MHMIDVYRKNAAHLGVHKALQYKNRDYLYPFCNVTNKALDEVRCPEDSRLVDTAGVPILMGAWSGGPVRVINDGDWVVINAENKVVRWVSNEYFKAHYYTRSNKDIDYVELAMTIHHKDGTETRFDLNSEVSPYEVEINKNFPDVFSDDGGVYDHSLGIKLRYREVDITDHLYTLTEDEESKDVY